MRQLWIQWWRHGLVVLMMTTVVSAIFAYYRAEYNHARRLRIVTEGKLYRSGQLTANGFREAFHRFGIKTVINFQDEAKDPYLPASYMSLEDRQLESELCAKHGVRYVSLDGNVLEKLEEGQRPQIVEVFFGLMRDPKNLPILIHCKAGLHRTGFMTAVYRMQFEGRRKDDVVRELRANGFGTFGATSGNEYMQRYILDFHPTGEHRP
ncbi:MAG: fused DSP-PTPase phosphatase/NAD kinase-like protein [Fimbriiglobus sp.]